MLPTIGAHGLDGGLGAEPAEEDEDELVMALAPWRGRMATRDPFSQQRMKQAEISIDVRERCKTGLFGGSPRANRSAFVMRREVATSDATTMESRQDANIAATAK